MSYRATNKNGESYEISEEILKWIQQTQNGEFTISENETVKIETIPNRIANINNTNASRTLTKSSGQS